MVQDMARVKAELISTRQGKTGHGRIKTGQDTLRPTIEPRLGPDPAGPFKNKRGESNASADALTGSE